jgi:pyruvate dehydrogenase E2 component (dihydrolipoamide acetyltransferase)
MAIPLLTPRVNNNDDTVRLVHLFVEPKTQVRRGDPVADVETEKATFTVEVEQDGYILGFNASKGDMIEVGSVLAWIGSSADEPLPQTAQPERRGTKRESRATTLKAALLLAQYNIDAERLGAGDGRITSEEVERYIAERGIAAPARANAQAVILPHLADGQRMPFSPEELGMLRTVDWHKREAVPAYAEIVYEDSRWKAYASDFQKTNQTLLDPLLSLFAWRLVQIAKKRPQLNATVAGSEKYLYDHVNLGFTVQTGQHLYVAVVREAEALGEADFVHRLGELQRRALKHKLQAEEISGATIGFSSMARWTVTRHVPILMPYTAMLVAHTAARSGVGHLGATYDHRILSGGDVVLALQELASPEDKSK